MTITADDLEAHSRSVPVIIPGPLIPAADFGAHRPGIRAGRPPWSSGSLAKG